jgi:thiosulfate dehydrogenase (quinone) large subunit
MSTTQTVPAAPTNNAVPIVAPPETSAKVVSAPREKALRYVWAATRLGLGWIFLWAFLDKAFGLGHETASADSWIHGGSPTEGFLSGSVGPFSSIYHSIAGAGLVDGLFMVGLAVIGVLLLLGIGMRFACGAGALMVVLMWSAALPPENNPFLDDHIIYALVLIGLVLAGAGNTLGLGRWWTKTSLVQRFPWLT